MEHDQRQAALEGACQLLERLFITGKADATSLDHHTLVHLLFVRKQTLEEQDRRFDQLVLDAGRLCDERARDGHELHLQQLFHFLAGFFGKVETALGHIARLAFMDCVHLTVELLQALKKDQTIFDSLESGLFRRLFIDELLTNPLMGSYGRRRIKSLVQGIESAASPQATGEIERIATRLRLLEKEERLFMWLLDIIRERMTEPKSSYLTHEGRAVLAKLATLELRHRRLVEGDVPEELFQRALSTIKKEAVYLNVVLPRMLQGDRTIRDEFIRDAGLDLFYIEELEERFCSEQGIDRAWLRATA